MGKMKWIQLLHKVTEDIYYSPMTCYCTARGRGRGEGQGQGEVGGWGRGSMRRKSGLGKDWYPDISISSTSAANTPTLTTLTHMIHQHPFSTHTHTHKQRTACDMRELQSRRGNEVIMKKAWDDSEGAGGVASSNELSTFPEEALEQDVLGCWENPASP